VLAGVSVAEVVPAVEELLPPELSKAKTIKKTTTAKIPKSHTILRRGLDGATGALFG
jgi:hypothetical protein